MSLRSLEGLNTRGEPTIHPRHMQFLKPPFLRIITFTLIKTIIPISHHAPFHSSIQPMQTGLYLNEHWKFRN